MNPKIGKVCNINHSRKGLFTAKVIADDGEWVKVQITAGETTVMNPDNRSFTGDVITLRKSCCTFGEPPREKKGVRQ